MADQLETGLEWRAGEVPVSTRFQDPYYSLEDGLAETRHTFLDGNDLPARFAPGFHVAELGFGTGLNFLSTWQLWLESGQAGPLQFTSFEAFPLSAAATARALAPFAGLAPLADQLCAALDSPRARPGPHQFDAVSLTIVKGDVRTTLPAQTWQADAWFLDGFSPAKNPEMWEASLMAEIANHTKAGGTCATYTAAGFVRRALSDAGFSMTRAPGFGRKRHMSRGVMAHKAHP